MRVEPDYALYIRERRQEVCFPIINRGVLWYNRLTKEQLDELETWYQAWLDAPETRLIPATPTWVNSKIDKKEVETEEILI